MKLNQSNLTHLRIQQHAMIQKLIGQEQFIQAQSLIQETINKYGNFIGLISDYCAMAYMNGDYTTFNYQVNRLQLEFYSCQHLLSIESNLRTRLTLGKFLEEKLELTNALSVYHYELMPKDQFNETEVILLQKLAAQKLRLQAQLSVRHFEVGQSYLECLNYSSANFDLLVELEHALVLAEIELLGIEYALPRFKQLIDRKLKNWEYRLIVFDVIESLIRKNINYKMDQSIIASIVKSKEKFDLFESILFKIYQNQSVSINELQSTQISNFSRLRILQLLNIKNNHKYYQIINLMIDGLSKNDQNLVRRFVTLNTVQQIQIQLISKNKFKIDHKEIKLKNQVPVTDLFHLLHKNKQIDLSDAIHILFGQEFTESNFLRLRVMISRLNKSIQIQTGIHRLLVIKNQHVQLNPSAEFI